MDIHIWQCTYCGMLNRWENNYCHGCRKHYQVDPVRHNPQDVLHFRAGVRETEPFANQRRVPIEEPPSPPKTCREPSIPGEELHPSAGAQPEGKDAHESW